ncbi:hypothetical protein KAI87_05500, partial [Myxococcota bacterium]|nr:hypothetical protein [Myxococcota bacterium]
QGGRTYAAAPSPSRSRSVAISASAITLFVKNGSNKSRVKNGSVIAHGAKLQLYWKGEVRGQWVLIARTSDKKIHIIGKGYKSSGSARLFSLPNALLFGTAVDLMLVENVSEGGGVHNISQALASGGVRGQWRVRLVAAD